MGTNINYDADFDACKGEIGKLGDIDYGSVETLCKKLLAEKSKDMRLLSFLGLVYLRGAKWECLADVFEGFVTLCAQNYDAMFPDRERAKQNAVKWLSEPRFNETVAAQKPEEADYAHIARLLANLSSLKGILQEKFPEGSPFPAAFYSAASNWEKACKPKPKPAEGTPAPAGAGAPAAESMETPKQAQLAARKAAFFLIEKESQRPMGFRLMRSIRWDIFEKIPPNENGKTQLAPPPAELVASLNAMIANKEFKPALDKAEVAFTAGANHLWFGLQRIAALACQGLGETYKAVEQAITYETGFLVKRLPDITKLSFSDGSPFCDDATREWLSKQVLPSVSSGGPAAESKEADASAGDKVEEEKKQVAALGASGKTEAALDLLQKSIRNSSNERDNFRRSIVMCNMLMGAKQPDIALSILDSLDGKIQLYHLDKWDPDLAVDAWSIMIKVLKVARANKPAPVQASMAEKQNTILSKISQIDPKKAFSLTT
jgi:type VI secretion system protein VasJ